MKKRKDLKEERYGRNSSNWINQKEEEREREKEKKKETQMSMSQAVCETCWQVLPEEKGHPRSLYGIDWELINIELYVSSMI